MTTILISTLIVAGIATAIGAIVFIRALSEERRANPLSKAVNVEPNRHAYGVRINSQAIILQILDEDGLKAEEINTALHIRSRNGQAAQQYCLR